LNSGRDSPIFNRVVEQGAIEPIFQALAHPLRRDLLARLTREEATVGQLAAPYDVSLNAVSKHLKVLEGAGLVRRRWIATEARLRAVPTALQPARDWLAQLERFWGTQLDALEAHLDADPEAAPADDRDVRPAASAELAPIAGAPPEPGAAERTPAAGRPRAARPRRR
jgi:DNA-binding transcriptional ArsR family regulator